MFREPITPQLLAAAVLMGAGVWLHLSERHEHEHLHEALEHEHRHVHDAHHQHDHAADDPPGEPHSHPHRHAPRLHAHPHYPRPATAIMLIRSGGAGQTLGSTRVSSSS